VAERSFKIIADIDNVEQLECDLSFHPCNTKSPAALTSDEIVAYNKKGYVTGLDIFNRAEMDDIRGYLDSLLVRAIASGKNSYSINSAHLTHGRVYDLMKTPRIVDIVSDLLGENVVG